MTASRSTASTFTSFVMALSGLLLAPASGSAQTPSAFPDGTKVTLQADNGLTMFRCNGCQRTVANALPDSILLTKANPPFSIFTVRSTPGGKIRLLADNGNALFLCVGCIQGAATPDFIGVQKTGAPDSAADKFEIAAAGNGKYSLKAANGKFVSRCNGCSPGASQPDQVTAHSANSGVPYSQWTIAVVGAAPTSTAPPTSAVAAAPAATRGGTPPGAICDAPTGVHMATFDLLKFDVLSEGVFSLVESDFLSVQVTTARFNDKQVAAKAVAVRFGTVVHVFGAQGLSAKSAGLDGVVVAVEQRNTAVKWRAKDGTVVSATMALKFAPSGDPAFSVRVELPATARSAVRGLCGNFDGRSDNDTSGPDGKQVPLLPPKVWLPDGTNLASSWAVPDSRNLFTCSANCAGKR